MINHLLTCFKWFNSVENATYQTNEKAICNTCFLKIFEI